MRATALLVLILGLFAALPPTAASARAFPGARGFGVDTPAGRGGKILRVTNLKPTGPGSLREALDTKGPRIVIFDVGGVIEKWLFELAADLMR